MPIDCGFWCLLSERRRFVERLWRRRLLVTADERRAHRRFMRLMRGFDSEDLDVLRKAVETSGHEIKQCAPGPPMDVDSAGCSKAAGEPEEEEEGQEECGLIPQIDRPMSMPYLCCKMWRWKELQVDAALHRLDPMPWCRFGRVTINNATVSCCNPYHYALWIRPELSSSSEEQSLAGGVVANGGPNWPPEPSRFGDGESSSFGLERRRTLAASDETDLPPSGSPPPIPESDSVEDAPLAHELPAVHAQAVVWARLARYERKNRIGDVVNLVGQFVAVGKLAGTVFDGQDVRSDWDLQNHTSFSLIRQREQENVEDVWLYNSGDRPLFINVTSSLASHKSDAIRRLSPGYCIRVHRLGLSVGDPANSMTFLTISVGIGWGVNYQFVYVSDTPCRYEICFT
uniref:MH1 domain-containing protein n=1 Tax=Steinernema glaseri TaxID=37863 RepID=A0A1I8AF25_9BILA